MPDIRHATKRMNFSDFAVNKKNALSKHFAALMIRHRKNFYEENGGIFSNKVLLLTLCHVTRCQRSEWKLPLRGRITYRHCR